MDNFWSFIDNYPWVVVIAIVFGFGAIKSVMGAVVRTTQTRTFEQTRREVAAYVAEGSMTPEHAEQILAAGPKAKGGCGLG